MQQGSSVIQYGNGGVLLHIHRSPRPLIKSSGAVSIDRIEFDLNGLQVGVVVMIGLVISTFFILFRVIDGRGLLCP